VTKPSLTVSELLSRAQGAIVAEFPTPLWVRGQVTGYRRTSGGAGFFRLADHDVADAAVDVAARGRVMADIDRVLGVSGLGRLRDGVEIRVRGTIGVEKRSSVIRLSLLEIDPEFTAGRLAIDRAEVLGRMRADGSLQANAQLPAPLVPLRIGLITSRGSAAHADFIDQLRRSQYRFAVKTVHTTVQGGSAPDRIATAISRFDPGIVDIVALVRGGGSQLDLTAFDNETIARAIASSTVPVITGLGHDTDRTVADEAAAFAEKTPSAAGEWIVGRVGDFAQRLSTARQVIVRESQIALDRHRETLRRAASDVSGGASALVRQSDTLKALDGGISGSARRVVADQQRLLTSLGDWFSAVGIESTLRRGFAVVTGSETSRVVRSVSQVEPGDRLSLRFADGTVRVVVDSE
jgi:exodeoxyribonuclease VII large subunit